MRPSPGQPLAPVAELVPHRGTLSLLTRVLEADDGHAVAEVDIPGTGLFSRPQGTPSWLGIEYMAQTIAAWAGARARRRGQKPRIGYLLGTRRYVTAEPWFAPGSTLQVRVSCELTGSNGMGQFSCTIADASGRELATAMVSVFEPETND